MERQMATPMNTKGATPTSSRTALQLNSVIAPAMARASVIPIDVSLTSRRLQHTEHRSPKHFKACCRSLTLDLWRIRRVLGAQAAPSSLPGSPSFIDSRSMASAIADPKKVSIGRRTAH